MFGEFLPVDVEAATGDNREPAVSVRQAVMEISRELRHLEETGGSELSFSLRSDLNTSVKSRLRSSE
ncbi:MAG: hypothetical protein R2849_19720 [Thermomicrobiales bacterium]